MPSGNASPLSTSTNAKIVNQPANVILQLLAADQGVKQVRDHQHGDDQAKEVGAAHVRDEEAERGATRSYPVDALDHQQQDREHHDPENYVYDVHARTMLPRASRTRNESAATHNDFITAA